MVGAFNKILESMMMKVCNAERNYLDLRVPTVLWAYRMTCKKLTRQTHFRLMYGIQVVMPMEYIVHSLRIAAFLGMAYRKALEERLAQLAELQKDDF